MFYQDEVREFNEYLTLENTVLICYLHNIKSQLNRTQYISIKCYFRGSEHHCTNNLFHTKTRISGVVVSYKVKNQAF